MRESSDPRNADWLTVAHAVERILARSAPLPSKEVGIADTIGSVLAETIIAPIDQPSWDNSGMDGFACRSTDVRGASAERPVELRVTETVRAGGFATRTVGAGEAIAIMTGAPVPAGADSVVRIEHTRPLDDGRIVVEKDVDAGRNIRPRGEDFRGGEAVLDAGRVIRPAEVGVLAAVGKARVRVHRAPRVAILATGDELVDLDAFAEVAAGRRIVNSNSHALAAAVRAMGGRPELLGIARDDRSSLRLHLEAGLHADVLITTAGASVGEHDLVKDVLLELGMRLDFWRVQMRPGSPFSFGRIEPYGPLVFSLPGNPVSALVTFEVLVRPALRRLAGRRAVHNRTVRVRAAERIPSRPGLVHFLRARLEPDGTGGWLARLTGPQGSGILTSMAKADALLVVPLDGVAIEQGAPATAMLLEPVDASQDAPGY